MQYLFDAPVYHKRRSALAKSIGSGFIWIAGNADSPINYAANYYPFRQDSNFLYYGGLNLPHLNLVIDCVSGETTLYGDDLTIEDVVWTGPKPSLRELADKVGIEHVSPANAISGAIHGKDVHGLPCYRMEHFNLEKQIASSMELPSMDLVRAVISQREIKEDVEIAQMEQALAITAQMHTRAMTTVAEGMTESVLAGVAEGVAIANGCRLAYGAIVTRNGHILHNHDHHNVLANGDLVLCDMGSENRMLYAADITRTFPVSKTFTDRQKAIYNIVLEAETR